MRRKEDSPLRKSYGTGEVRVLPRMRRGRMLLVVAAAVSIAAALYVIVAPPGVPADGETREARIGGGIIDTRWGRLSADDRALLVAVRQAGLWEMPAGQQAQQRAASPRVKEVGQMIAEQHARLDEDVRTVAKRLEVILPNEPSQQQKFWLAEMSDRFGAEYDRTFVLRLRAAHGKVFGVLAQTRAKTENSEIRAFAERSMKYVNTHMTLLESTGLVTKSAL
jgi:predicted outer membrane protein